MTERSLEAAVELAQSALLTAAEVALPVLAVALAVAILFSLIQTVTQVQEQSITFVPRLLAVAGAVFVLMPWFLSVLSEYTRSVLGQLAQGVPSP